MEQKKQTILLIAIIALLIIGGIFMFFQYQSLKKLKNLVMPEPNNQTADSFSKKVEILPDYIVVGEKKELLEGTYDIIGRVVGIEGNNLTVEAEIVDLEKMNEAKLVNEFAKIKKTYKVVINSNTDFPAQKIANIKKNGRIRVFSKELVYSTDSLTATRVIFPFASETEANQPRIFNYITGKIEEIRGNDIEIKGFISKDKQKDYKITVGGEAKFIKKDANFQDIGEIKFSEIKIGDIILAFSSDDIENKNEFSATKAYLLPPLGENKN